MINRLAFISSDLFVRPVYFPRHFSFLFFMKAFPILTSPFVLCLGLFHSLNLGAMTFSSSVQSLSLVRLFATPWIAVCQASLSITNSRSPPKPMSTELVMPSSRLILCHPLLLLPLIPPSIRVPRPAQARVTPAQGENGASPLRKIRERQKMGLRGSDQNG